MNHKNLSIISVVALIILSAYVFYSAYQPQEITLTSIKHEEIKKDEPKAIDDPSSDTLITNWTTYSAPDKTFTFSVPKNIVVSVNEENGFKQYFVGDSQKVLYGFISVIPKTQKNLGQVKQEDLEENKLAVDASNDYQTAVSISANPKDISVGGKPQYIKYFEDTKSVYKVGIYLNGATSADYISSVVLGTFKVTNPSK